MPKSGEESGGGSIRALSLARRRRRAPALREPGPVVPGRGFGAESEPLLPGQNSSFVCPPDRQVLVSKASRPRRAVGGADPWRRSRLHCLIPTPTEVPS